MDRFSGSWHSSSRGIERYYFDRYMVELTQDQIPEDYDKQFEDFQFVGGIRYCLALLDRHNNPDPNQLCIHLYGHVFEYPTRNRIIPWGIGIPRDFKYHCDDELFEYIESVYKDEDNKNINKFLIVVKFGVLLARHVERDDELRFGFVTIEGSEKVLGLKECAICLGEEEKEGERMPCGHVFHGQCIQRWLERSLTCPLCRYAMRIHGHQFITFDD